MGPPKSPILQCSFIQDDALCTKIHSLKDNTRDPCLQITESRFLSKGSYHDGCCNFKSETIKKLFKVIISEFNMEVMYLCIGKRVFLLSLCCIYREHFFSQNVPTCLYFINFKKN